MSLQSVFFITADNVKKCQNVLYLSLNSSYLVLTSSYLVLTLDNKSF